MVKKGRKGQSRWIETHKKPYCPQVTTRDVFFPGRWVRVLRDATRAGSIHDPTRVPRHPSMARRSECGRTGELELVLGGDVGGLGGEGAEALLPGRGPGAADEHVVLRDQRPGEVGGALDDGLDHCLCCVFERSDRSVRLRLLKRESDGDGPPGLLRIFPEQHAGAARWRTPRADEKKLSSVLTFEMTEATSTSKRASTSKLARRWRSNENG